MSTARRSAVPVGPWQLTPGAGEAADVGMARAPNWGHGQGRTTGQGEGRLHPPLALWHTSHEPEWMRPLSNSAARGARNVRSL